jgi:hypothetical protein
VALCATLHVPDAFPVRDAAQQDARLARRVFATERLGNDPRGGRQRRLLERDPRRPDDEHLFSEVECPLQQEVATCSLGWTCDHGLDQDSEDGAEDDVLTRRLALEVAPIARASDRSPVAASASA